MTGRTRSTRSTKLSPPGGRSSAGPNHERVRADLALGIEGLALHALPLAQVLLGEVGDGERLDRRVPAVGRRQDGGGRLPGAREIAGHPHRVARQLARQHAEDLRILQSQSRSLWP